MDPLPLVFLGSLLLSVLAYFIPSIRNGKKVFSPLPGVVALRLGIGGEAKESSGLKTELVLNSLLVLFLIALVLGYYLLISSLVPRTRSGVTLVPLIPGVTIPFSELLSILWIIGLSILIHEYMHYWSSIKQGISVKNAGIGWAFVFPIAFVEPDERDLLNSSLIKRVRVYAAGPAANMMVAIITYLLILNLLKPGLYVVGVVKHSPAWESNIVKGDVIVSVNGESIKSLYELKKAIMENEVLRLKVLRGNKVIEVTVKPENGKIGVIVLPFRPTWPLSSLPVDAMLFAVNSLFWLNGVNMGLAIINALPLFISDGGRVLEDVSRRSSRLRFLATATQAVTVLLVAGVLLKSLRALG